jgi:hypothetical protein
MSVAILISIPDRTMTLETASGPWTVPVDYISSTAKPGTWFWGDAGPGTWFWGDMTIWFQKDGSHHRAWSITGYDHYVVRNPPQPAILNFPGNEPIEPPYEPMVTGSPHQGGVLSIRGSGIGETDKLLRFDSFGTHLGVTREHYGTGVLLEDMAKRYSRNDGKSDDPARGSAISYYGFFVPLYINVIS